MKQYLEAAQIINKRGLRGEVKVDCFCDTLDTLCEIKTLYFDENGQNPAKIIAAKPYKGFVYLTIEGINSVEAADKLRGKILFADRDDIPVEEGSFFIEDLLGLDMIDADTGKVYGKIKDIFNTGANDIYTVNDGTKDYYIPAVEEFITETDLDRGVFIRPIPGMFDEAESVK
jgi:16S rRNA processing protein RimM